MPVSASLACSPPLSWRPQSATLRGGGMKQSRRRLQNLRRLPESHEVYGTSDEANGAPMRAPLSLRPAMCWKATPKRIKGNQRNASRVSSWPCRPTRHRLGRKPSFLGSLDLQSWTRFMSWSLLLLTCKTKHTKQTNTLLGSTNTRPRPLLRRIPQTSEWHSRFCRGCEADAPTRLSNYSKAE